MARKGRRAYLQEWYRTHKEQVRLNQLRYRKTEHGKATMRARQNRCYARQKVLLDAIKIASGCVDCGYKDNPLALDFDHLTDKKFQVSHKRGRASDKTLLAEVAKCEVRCANCHRIRSWEK